MAETNVRHIGQRSLGASIQLPESSLGAAGALGLPTVDIFKANVSFSFHRRHRDGVSGWATHLHLDALTLCGPWTEGLPFPRRRVDAERCVHGFCERHGIMAMLNVRYDPRGRRTQPPLRLVP